MQVGTTTVLILKGNWFCISTCCKLPKIENSKIRFDLSQDMRYIEKDIEKRAEIPLITEYYYQMPVLFPPFKNELVRFQTAKGCQFQFTCLRLPGA